MVAPHAELNPEQQAPHGCWEESGIPGHRHSIHKDNGKDMYVLDTEAKELTWERPEDAALLMVSDLWTHLLATIYLHLPVNAWGLFTAPQKCELTHTSSWDQTWHSVSCFSSPTVNKCLLCGLIIATFPMGDGCLKCPHVQCWCAV